MHHLSSSRHRVQSVERERNRGRERKKQQTPLQAFHLGICRPPSQSTHLAARATPLRVVSFLHFIFHLFSAFFGKVGKVKTETEGTEKSRRVESSWCSYCCWGFSNIDFQNHCKNNPQPYSRKIKCALLGLILLYSYCNLRARRISNGLVE